MNLFSTPELDYLVCVETGSGKEIWKLKLESPIAATPTLSNDVLYYGSFDRHLYALDQRTGNRKWKLRMDHRILHQGAVDGGNLWFPADDHRFHWVNVEKPGEIATLDIEEGPTPVPQASDGLTCIKLGASLTVIDSVSGKFVWSPPLPVEVLFSPKINAGIVYCHTSDGHLRALDVENRRELWSGLAPQEYSSIIAVGGGMVFSRYAGNQIRAFDAATGEVRWTLDSEGECVSAPAYSDGLVFVIAYSQNLDGFCLNAETGEPVWRFKLGPREDTDEGKEQHLYSLTYYAPLCDGSTAFFHDCEGNLLAVGND